MKALILAAGVSRRLYPITYNKPKCLLVIGGKPIINHQLNAIEKVGIKEVIVVVGYYREAIISHLTQSFPDMNFHFIVNHHHFETNTAYSLSLCREKINGKSFILMNGDVLYPAEVLQAVIQSEKKTILAVDIKPCGREEVKVIEGNENRIVAIGKELIEDNALGEFIGVAKFSNSFSFAFMESLETLVRAGGNADYFEAAIHPLLNIHEVYYTDVSALPCIEIDFAEDLDEAHQLVKSSHFK